MKNITSSFLVLLCTSLNFCNAQSKLLSYSITNNTSAPQSSNIGIAGYNVIGLQNFSPSSTYNLFYAQKSTGASGFSRNVTGFTTAAGTFSTYFSSAVPFTKVVLNRVEPAVPVGNKYTALFETSSVTDNTGAVVASPSTSFPLPAGSNVYIEPPFSSTMETFLNSYSLNRGTDNVFVNDGTLNNTSNNIERIDLINSNGFSAQGLSANLAKVGILLNERGGNDDFKVAAITALNGSGNISALAAIKNVSASLWGQVGPTITSVVLQRNGGDPLEKPSQCIVAQTISGIFVSLSDLGIVSNTQVIYGVAVFPPDFTGNAITLAGVNTNSDATNGLDLMSGNFIAKDITAVLPVTLLEFGATQKDCAAVLTWKTAEEINTDRFEIEVSNDNELSFKKAGIVYPNTHPAAENSYTYLLSTDPGSNTYVRLKMINKDGTYAYGPVRVLRKCTAEKPFSIYPNPAADYLNVSFSDTKAKQVAVYNTAGRKLYSSTATSNSRINLKSFAAGTYLLSVTLSDGSIVTERFVKY